MDQPAAGVVPFLVTVPPGTLEDLDERVDTERKRHMGWWNGELARARAAGTYRARRAAHAWALAERGRRRAQGRMLDTRDALLAWYVREHLRARGWDRPWDPVPEGVSSVPGRPPGTQLHQNPERLPVKLPAPLAERVRAAAYWCSKDAVERGEAPPVSAAGIIRSAALAAVEP